MAETQTAPRTRRFDIMLSGTEDLVAMSFKTPGDPDFPMSMAPKAVLLALWKAAQVPGPGSATFASTGFMTIPGYASLNDFRARTHLKWIDWDTIRLEIPLADLGIPEDEPEPEDDYADMSCADCGKREVVEVVQMCHHGSHFVCQACGCWMDADGQEITSEECEDEADSDKD